MNAASTEVRSAGDAKRLAPVHMYVINFFNVAIRYTHLINIKGFLVNEQPNISHNSISSKI